MQNPLRKYDPEQPENIPEEFTKRQTKSIYFSNENAHLIYLAGEVVKECGLAGLNDAIAEGLELWIEKRKQQYLRKQVDKCKAKLRELEAIEDELSPEAINKQLKEIHAIAWQCAADSEKITKQATLHVLFEDILKAMESHHGTNEFEDFLAIEWAERAKNNPQTESDKDIIAATMKIPFKYVDDFVNLQRKIESDIENDQKEKFKLEPKEEK